jgi:mevalonate pyrophosphate decarboxylase
MAIPEKLANFHIPMRRVRLSMPVTSTVPSAEAIFLFSSAASAAAAAAATARKENVDVDNNKIKNGS